MGLSSADAAERLWPDNLQELQDSFSCSIGVPILFVDTLGRPLAACEDLSEFCRQFTRAIPLLRPCLECGREAQSAQSLTQGDHFRKFRSMHHLCPLGVVDIALPVLSAGEALGYIVTAQMRCEYKRGVLKEVSLNQVEQDTEEYLTQLTRLPRRSQEELDDIAAGLTVLSNLVSALASARRRNLRIAQKMRQQSRWIQEHVETDAVTRVSNQRSFCAHLKAEMDRSRRYRRNLALAVLEIEGLQEINREFGHDIGDAVLRAVAQSLQSTIRQTDLVARIKGDEFALLLPETSRHEAMIALARVEQNIADLNALGELPVEVHLSAGLVERTSDIEDLLTAAAEAVKQARRAGDPIV